MNEKQYHLVKVIQKIELFRDFDSGDVQRLLRICHFHVFSVGEHIYTRGEASDEMLILLKGRLRVVGVGGEEFATIGPGSPIGEMGLFTGQPRSADILAAARSTAIVLRASELRLLLSKAPEMHIKVLRNVVVILSARLADANGLTEAQGALVRKLQQKVDEHSGPGHEYDDDEYVDEDDEFDSEES